MMTVISSILQVVNLVIFGFSQFNGVPHCNALSLDLDDTALGNSYDPERKYDFPTDWPFNVDPELSKPVITTPVYYTTGPLAELVILNNGKTVLMKYAQKRILDSIYGGPLGNNTFIFEFGQFFWANDAKGRAASTLNNQSFPLEWVLYHWNTKYDNFSNALNYRDGLAVLEFLFIVVSFLHSSLRWPVVNGTYGVDFAITEDILPNPLYEPLGQALREITQAGTEAHTIIGPVSLIIFPNTPEYYYLFAGSYTDEDTGKIYYCAQYIFQPLPAIISTSQFQDFLNLRDFDKRPLTHQTPLFPYQGQQIVTGVGATAVTLV